MKTIQLTLFFVAAERGGWGLSLHIISSHYKVEYLKINPPSCAPQRLIGITILPEQKNKIKTSFLKKAIQTETTNNSSARENAFQVPITVEVAALTKTRPARAALERHNQAATFKTGSKLRLNCYCIFAFCVVERFSPSRRWRSKRRSTNQTAPQYPANNDLQPPHPNQNAPLRRSARNALHRRQTQHVHRTADRARDGCFRLPRRF